MALFEYLRQTQRFIRDATQVMVEPDDLVSYVNRARRELAGRTQCIRVLTPIFGAVTTVTIGSGGSGYKTTDTFAFAPPDSPSGAAPWPSGRQAVGALVVDGAGRVLAINVIDGGDGYFSPSGTISTTTGSGCTFSIQTSPLSATVMDQEVYNFSAMNLSRFPGVGSIIAVRSVAIIYANYRYVLLPRAWSVYQAMIRQYPRQYYYVPTFCSQFGQGAAGSLYMYPIASAPYQMEWDCTCLPADLLSDQDPEAIPLPWTDAVPFRAAFYAFSELQNLNAAEYYDKKFEQFLARYSAMSRPGSIPNLYGRA